MINLLLGEQKNSSYLAKNPTGYVPALEIDGVFYGESMAILEWIEETYSEKPLLPVAPLDRLRVRQLANMITSGIQPLQNLAVIKRHSSDTAEQAKWSNEWITNGLAKVETVLKTTARTYTCGETVTFADLCLIPQMYNALRFNVDISAFPIANRIYEHCLKLPDCESAAPHNQKGAQ
jgi:maleylacetoacetate isomerase